MLEGNAPVILFPVSILKILTFIVFTIGREGGAEGTYK
jgi:hypothetical protein